VGELVKFEAATAPPGHIVEFEGMLTIGIGLTVTVAAADVTEPQALVTITSYEPASALLTEATLYVDDVAPKISRPFFRH
jgi:hypothetical protein